MSDSVLPRLAALPGKTMGELKQDWRELFGTEPPPFNRRFLESRLAYRIQELAFGGLSEETRARLEALSRDERYVGRARIKKRPDDRPVEGTRLIREWGGAEHCVTVLRNGYEYRGQIYKSLSPVARRITGTPTNGPMFFGLRSETRRRR